MTEREEAPLKTVGGMQQIRDWKNRFAAGMTHLPLPIPCPDPGCTADHAGGDTYCIVTKDFNQQEATPEPTGGQGAAVIPAGTSGAVEPDWNAVGDSLDNVNFALETEDRDITWKALTKIKTGRRESRVEYLVKTFKEPVKHPVIRGCTHKFEPLRQPRHRNCQSCWNAFFWNQNEFTENIAKNITDQGPEIVGVIYGKIFLTNFLRFARLLAEYEMVKARAAQNDTAN